MYTYGYSYDFANELSAPRIPRYPIFDTKGRMKFRLDEIKFENRRSVRHDLMMAKRDSNLSTRPMWNVGCMIIDARFRVAAPQDYIHYVIEQTRAR